MPKVTGGGDMRRASAERGEPNGTGDAPSLGQFSMAGGGVVAAVLNDKFEGGVVFEFEPDQPTLVGGSVLAKGLVEVVVGRGVVGAGGKRYEFAANCVLDSAPTRASAPASRPLPARSRMVSRTQTLEVPACTCHEASP